MGSEVQRRQVRFISRTDSLTRLDVSDYLIFVQIEIGSWIYDKWGKKALRVTKKWRNKVFWVIHKNTPYAKQQRMKACRTVQWEVSPHGMMQQAGSRSCCIALISKVEWIILKFWTNFSSLSQTLFWQILSSLAACCLAATLNDLGKHLVLIFLLWQLSGWQCTSSMETRNVFFCLVFPISEFADDDLVRLFKTPEQLFE